MIFFAHDEGGGFFDHVPPLSVPSPDGIKPVDLTSDDVPGDFTITGSRVPNMVISPFAKKNFVSHTPMDYTPYLHFIETRWSLSPLTARDAAMPDNDRVLRFRQQTVGHTAFPTSAEHEWSVRLQPTIARSSPPNGLRLVWVTAPRHDHGFSRVSGLSRFLR